MRSISCGGCIEPFIVTALVLALVRNLSRLQALAWLAPCRYDFYCGPPCAMHLRLSSSSSLLSSSWQGLRDRSCQVTALGVRGGGGG